MILNRSLILAKHDKQLVKTVEKSLTAFTRQTASFRKIVQCSIRKLKTMYHHHHMITNYPYCRPVLPAIELCLCIPHSNVTLEKYFSQTSLIKKTLWRQLNNQFERSLTYQNQQTILQYFSQGTCPRMCTSLVQNQGTQQGKCKVSKKGLTDSLNFLSTSSEADALVKRV